MDRRAFTLLLLGSLTGDSLAAPPDRPIPPILLADVNAPPNLHLSPSFLETATATLEREMTAKFKCGTHRVGPLKMLADSKAARIRAFGHLHKDADYLLLADVINVLVPGERFRVTMQFRLFDLVIGKLYNGAIATGFSSSTTGEKEWEQAKQVAFMDACKNGVLTMIDYTLPVATIIGIEDKDRLILDKGAADGFVSGLELGIVQDRTMLGYARVTLVERNCAHAVRLNAPAQIGAQARALFRLPSYIVGAGSSIRSSVDESKKMVEDP